VNYQVDALAFVPNLGVNYPNWVGLMGPFDLVTGRFFSISVLIY